MNKTELIAAIAEKAEISRKDAEKALKAFTDVVAEELVKGEKVHSVAEVVLLKHEKVNTGVVEKLLDEISYRALPEALIEKIEVDVGDMKLGDSIKVKDLPIASDKDIDLLTDPETVVANVTAVRNAVETTDEEGTAEEAAQ